jgi:predicted ATP-binding protein involved in virulence
MAEEKQTILTKPETNGGKTTPVYFQSLIVENFKCFGPKQTLDLSDGNDRPAHWTVILGDNNTGKTTLLQLLVLMEPCNILIHSNKDKEKEIWVPRALKSKILRKSNLKEGDRYSLRIQYFYGCSLLPKNIKMNTCGAIYKTDSCTILPSDLAGWKCFGYGAIRKMGETSLSEAPSNEPWASLFNDKTELINAEEWLLQADYSASKADGTLKEKAQEKRDTVKDMLIHLLPEIDDIRFTSPTAKDLKPRVEFKTPYGWITLDGLSLGYKTMIAWMVDLAHRLFERYPKSKNPLAEPAVVLVDEIDLHMHPRWQRQIMSYLSERFPNTQFIVTAHSPLIVQSAPEGARVVLLRREGDHVVIDNKPQSIRGWRLDQILTSDLFGLETARSPQLEEVLTERTKILSKSRLTKADKEKLKTLEEQIGQLPTAEKPEDIEAMNIIREAAKILKRKNINGRD